MSLRPLLAHLDATPEGAALARDGGRAFVSASLRPYLVAALVDGAAGYAARPTVIVAGDDRQARDLAADLRAWLAPRPVRFYPGRGVAYESHLAPPPHLVGLRVAALDALVDHDSGTEGEPPVVVVSAVALSEKVPDPALRPHGLRLAVGDLVDLEELSTDLVRAGYDRVEQVSDRGQFAVRGGILDVFPATEERAVRVELFDIEIESLRWFSTFTQRSLGDAQAVEIAPAAELAPEHRELAQIAATDEDRPDIAELLPVDRFGAFLDLAGDAAVILAAEEEVEPALRDHWQDVCAAFHDVDAHHLYVAPNEISAALDARAAVRLSAIAGDQPLEFRAQAADTAARSLKEAEPELEKLVRGGYRTVVAWPRRGEGDRAAYNLARLKASWLGEGDDGHSTDGRVRFANASLRDGFVAGGLKLAVIPEHRLFRRRRAERSDDGAGGDAGRRRRGALRSFADLRTQDIIVHEDHGVARFAGFDTRTVVGVTRDYLQLEFQGSDKVYMPVEQLAKISRYVGAGGSHPPLSKLGGKSWETMKARARRSAQEMAGELLNLYAERKRRAGTAFEPDGDWQRDFEERFPYTETGDQLEAIELVKADMESSRPMDRLVCGDVGYGKTEVALRAAFKCAADGKQVLMLVPTTILAQQHFGTFAERLADWPFRVEHVSRFRSAAEQRAAIEAFGRGQVDVLVGTHRLLSRDVRAKELGLIVVDEEQRFGVKQKELLRQLKLKRRRDLHERDADPAHAADVAGRGARHLGHRDAARGPPAGQDLRGRVRRGAGPPGAGARERKRGGQAFFLHNRVETIDETAERLRGLLPDVRFAVAHGQLDEQDLEERMLAFLRGEADVLVCHQHHRVGHRHSLGQHADHRRAPIASGWPSSTRSAGGWAARASAATPTCSIPVRRR